MGLELGLAVVLVIANGFFVATEFSVARLRPTQVSQMLREGRPGAKSAQYAIDHIDAYLSACQLGITLSSLGLGALGEPAFHDLIEPLLGDSAEIAGFGLATLVAFAVITTLHVVFGELAPKSAAISRTVPVVLALALPMRIFYTLTRPLVDGFNFLGNLVLKPFGVPPASEAGSAPHTEDELRELLQESSRQGFIDSEEQQMSDRALVFGDVRAREAMKPRSEIDYVSNTDDVRAIAERAVATGRTRLPLCPHDGDLEDALGVVNAKDLLPLLLSDAEPDLGGLVRPLAHASESARLDEVLRDMRADRLHLALVYDEHGTVTGLITMEDVIEELVGEISDEFDTDEVDLIREEADGRLVVQGNAPARVLADRLGAAVGDFHETTVGGYLSEELARVPEPGETVQLMGHVAEVLAVEGTRVTSVAVLGAQDEDVVAPR